MNILVYILAFVIGAAVGAAIIYKWEEKVLTTMLNECASLGQAERELREEKELYREKREQLTTIADVPAYLKDKYQVPPGVQIDTFDDDDELPEIYI